MFIETTARQKIFKLRKRIRGVSGGTGASKTISILQWLINRAGTKNFGDIKDNETISVVSEFLPQLKRGAIRDFLNIMQEHHAFDDKRWNRSDYIYTFPSGSQIEFFSADQSYKVRGPRRDILFINEANNIDYDTYTQLEIRTNKIIWLDWNPTSEFWFYTDVIPHNDVDFLTLTFLDNEALEESIVETIFSRKSNTNWWRIYGEGKLGFSENRIYNGWEFVDNVPPQARLERYGLDFGFTHDEAACVAVYYMDGKFILDEMFYRKGLGNSEIASLLKSYPQTLVVADSAEPKSIYELSTYGIKIKGTWKGKDSVNYGIQYIQDQKIAVTKRSVNLIKEYRNYFWQRDMNGKIINDPEEVFNHTMDALRYAIADRVKIGRKIIAGPVKIVSPKKEEYQLTINKKGYIQPPNLWQGIKDAQHQIKHPRW